MSRSESLKAHCAKPETKIARSKAQKKAWTNPERRAAASEVARQQGADQEIIEKRKKGFSKLEILECEVCGLQTRSHSMSRHKRRCGTLCEVELCEQDHHMKGYCRHHFKLSQYAKSFGITSEEMFSVFAHSNGKCEICKTKLVPHGLAAETRKNVACIDHDHDTGKIRGILCFRCNSGLGHFSDSAELVALALEYLQDRSGK